MSATEHTVKLPGGAHNLFRRGIAFDLLPWCRERHIAVMAYSPIEQARLLSHPMVRRVADRHAATAAQARWRGCCARRE